MGQIIVGRIICGIGGAGMAVIVSVLIVGTSLVFLSRVLSLVVLISISDLVPLREVASWRSYVNVVSTFGRSIGGPLGGFLSDTIGWRVRVAELLQ